MGGASRDAPGNASWGVSSEEATVPPGKGDRRKGRCNPGLAPGKQEGAKEKGRSDWRNAAGLFPTCCKLTVF